MRMHLNEKKLVAGDFQFPSVYEYIIRKFDTICNSQMFNSDYLIVESIVQSFSTNFHVVYFFRFSIQKKNQFNLSKTSHLDIIYATE